MSGPGNPPVAPDRHGIRRLWIFDHADIAGGGQRFALRLARYGSERRQVEVRVVCPAASTLAEWCRAAGVALTDATFPPLEPTEAPRMAGAVVRSRRLLRAAAPETLIVANSARVQAYLFAASRLGHGSARVVNLMHEQDSARRPSARFAYRRFGSLLVIGDPAAASYRERLPGVVVHQANNFLLEDEVAPFEALRRNAGSGTGRAVLGTIGRMIPEKGLVELVEELATDFARPLWSRLIVAAFAQDAGYERKLRARIDDLGLGSAVELVGPRPATEVLAEIDALLVPSVGYEAQPTVIIEALAAAVPVIVRSTLWSSAYEDLPIRGYDSSGELAAALRRLPLTPAPIPVIAGRFGPEQFMTALDGADGT